MKISYRRVDLKNIDEMQSIAAIDMAIPALFDPIFEVNEKTISERLQQLMKCQPDDFFDAAVIENGKIVGFHFVSKYTSPHGHIGASIQTLWVDPEFRKQGIAAALKKRAEVWAKEHSLDHILTFVHHKNSSMVNLNKNLGYDLVGYKLKKNLK